MTARIMDASVQDALLDSLHTLSQPLTALSFALALMSCKLDIAEKTELLKSAQAECERAVSNVAQLRTLVAGLSESGDAVLAADNFRSTAFHTNMRSEVA